MDPNLFNFPFLTSPPPLTYNFMQVSSTAPPSHCPQCPRQQVDIPIHSCAHLMELQRQNLNLFWNHEMLQLNHLAVYKQHQLPVARIKRVMKLDKNVKMVTADASVLFSKACELFILELTIRSWLRTEACTRHNLLKGDIANAISHAEQLSFLINIVTSNERVRHRSEDNLSG